MALVEDGALFGLRQLDMGNVGLVHPDVQRAVALARKNVDAGLFRLLSYDPSFE